jgi:restriction system protein
MPDMMPDVTSDVMPELAEAHAELRRLQAFSLATIVQLETLRFCRRFLTRDPRDAGGKFLDPYGHQYEQMTQAARSARRLILEGSMLGSTSRDSESTSSDLAIASLSELQRDYEIFLLDQRKLPWSTLSTDAKELGLLSLDRPQISDDMQYESAKHALDQRRKYAPWLDSEDPIVVANAMLILVNQTVRMVRNQLSPRRQVTEEPAPVIERQAARRSEPREEPRPSGDSTPRCPQCGNSMRRRKSVKGNFWGCSSYPDCNGTVITKP